MRRFTGQTFQGGRIGRSDATEDGYVFDKCWFQGSEVAVGRTERTHVRVSNVELRRCRVSGGGLLGVHLVDCKVSGLQVSSFPMILGCVFEHVTLAGKINKLMIRPELPTIDDQAPFLAAAAKAYERIDWALDISELDCKDLLIEGVPGRLIRRDPETQIVVRREALAGKPWRQVDFSGTYFATSIDFMFHFGRTEAILVAPRTGPKKEVFLRVIKDLRTIGVAE